MNTNNLYSITNCPCCSFPAKKSHFLFHVLLLGRSCSVFQCKQCNLVYKELAPTSQGFQEIYAQNYVHFQGVDSYTDLASRNSNKQKLDRCLQLLKKDHNDKEISLLDIGCGSGAFVETARSLGYNAQGIDPFLPPKLVSNYLRASSPKDLSEKSFDIITLLNVVEHLDKPRSFFSEVYRLLKPSGVMLLTCPYGNSMARRFHQSHWGHLALDEHLLFWNPYALTYLLREIGFEGKFSYRISGSPFPYGRVKNIVNQVISVEQNVESNHSYKKVSIQGSVWQAARYIQKHEAIANLVRSLVHITHTGDYLEYAICVSRSH